MNTPPVAAMKMENPRWRAMVKTLPAIRDPPRGSPQSRPGLPHPGPGFCSRILGIPIKLKNTVLIFVCSTLQNSRKIWSL